MMHNQNVDTVHRSVREGVCVEQVSSPLIAAASSRQLFELGRVGASDGPTTVRAEPSADADRP